MRRNAALASLVVLALSIVSLVFAILAATSKSWSSQAIYFDSPADDGTPSELGSGEKMPLCHWTRSPFYRCGVPQVDSTNKTCELPDCHYYPPSGKGRTSCRTGGEMGLDYTSGLRASLGLLGHRNECQQVHYAGNLQIAAIVFLGIALLLSLGVCARAAMPSDQDGADKSGAREEEEGKSTSRREQRQSRQRSTTVARTTIGMLLACLYIGIVLQILAQYFGVLGLTVNATPSLESGAEVQTAKLHFFVAETWEIGQGLSTYATTAWASAAACAATVSLSFARPRSLRML